VGHLSRVALLASRPALARTWEGRWNKLVGSSVCMDLGGQLWNIVAALATFMAMGGQLWNKTAAVAVCMDMGGQL
jgi:hypothetical protein